MYLRCNTCQHQELDSLERRIAGLRAIGLLGRKAGADPEIVDALFAASGNQIPCSRCGAAGLVRGEGAEVSTNVAADPFAEIEADPEAWGERRRCDDCGRPIEAERLEVLEQTRQCSECARAGQRVAVDEVEYCERCGGRLVMRRRRGAGLAGYEMRCDDCGAVG